MNVLVPETSQDQSIQNEAAKFVAERRTALWVAVQNFQQGQAPTGCKVVDRYLRRVAALWLGSALWCGCASFWAGAHIRPDGPEVVSSHAKKVGLEARCSERS